MADTTPILLSFGYGQKTNLPDYTQGKIYITTDTKEMYIDLPGTEDRLCLSNYLVGSSVPTTGESGQFFVKTATVGDETSYSLYCYENGGWKLIVDTAALQSTIGDLAASLGSPVANDAGKADGTAYERIAKNASDIAGHASRLTTVEATAGSALQPGDLDGYVTDAELEAYDTALRGGYTGTLKEIKEQADKGVNDAATAQGAAEAAQSAAEAAQGTANAALPKADVAATLAPYAKTEDVNSAFTTLKGGYTGTLESLRALAQTGIDNAATAQGAAEGAASAAATAQGAAEGAQGRADAAYELADSKTTMAAVEDKGYDTVSNVNNKFDALKDGSTSTLKSLDGKIEALESADEALDARIAPIEAIIGGVTGAMHFIGAFAEAPTKNGEADLQDGDVYVNTSNHKEYVYSGNAWVELGDTTQEAQRISALEEEINGKEGVEGLKARMTTAEGEIDALQSADEALSGRLDVLEGWDDGVDESINDHEQRIGALETTVNTTHAGLLNGLRSDLGVNDKDDTTAFARIAALESENETQTSAIVGLGNQLTWVAF